MSRFSRFISDTANRAKVCGISRAVQSHRFSPGLPSLFVVSLPRSFSSHTYLLARSALLMRQPNFTTFGEILNCNRFNKNSLPGCEVFPPNFFIRPERRPELFRQRIAFLDRIVRERGFAYKDVVQPFVVAAWLEARKEFRILRIRRNLADVAISMVELKWWYPTEAANCNTDIESALVEGLVWADNVLATLPAVTLEYEDLVRDGAALSKALARLYPEYELSSIRFHNNRLEQEHAKTIARRASPQYSVLERKIQDLRATLTASF